VVCGGASTTLTALDPGGTWAIAPGYGGIALSSSGVVTGIFTTGGAMISYTSPAGCVATQIMYVDIPLVLNPYSACVGVTVDLGIAPGGFGGPGAAIYPYSGTWTSSNISVATVTSTPNVTGVSPGTVTISFMSVNGCLDTAPFTVDVQPISSPIPLCVGGNIVLTAPSSGGAWSSGSTGVATVNSGGVVSGVSSGTAYITYTPSPFAGCYNIYHIAGQPSLNIVGSPSVCLGASISLSPSYTGPGYPAGGWSVDNATVATVNGSGVTTGWSTGTATINYYRSAGCQASKIIAVESPSISGNSVVCVGTTSTLTAPTAGGTWSSSNGAVATVSGGGVVSGIAAGTATISYSVGAGCFSTQLVRVPNISGAGQICVGSTYTLASNTSGGTWSSSNSAVAAVSSSGILTSSSTGNAMITYTTGGCTTTLSVTAHAVTATIPSQMCTGSVITLSGSPSGGTWTSTDPTVADPSYGYLTTFSLGGTVTITYHQGCTFSQNVTVHNGPVAHSWGECTTGSCVRGLYPITWTNHLSVYPTGGAWSVNGIGWSFLHLDVDADSGGYANATIYPVWFWGQAFITYTLWFGTLPCPITWNFDAF
jgi:uncharacterized protein YjdB